MCGVERKVTCEMRDKNYYEHSVHTTSTINSAGSLEAVFKVPRLHFPEAVKV